MNASHQQVEIGHRIFVSITNYAIFGWSRSSSCKQKEVAKNKNKTSCKEQKQNKLQRTKTKQKQKPFLCDVPIAAELINQRANGMPSSPTTLEKEAILCEKLLPDVEGGDASASQPQTLQMDNNNNQSLESHIEQSPPPRPPPPLRKAERQSVI